MVVGIDPKIAVILALTGLIASGAPAAAPHDAQTYFSCLIKGTKLLTPATSSAALCGRLQGQVGRALGKQLIKLPVSQALGGLPSNLIDLNIAVAKPASATATLRERRAGRQRVFLPVTIDVMDQKLDQSIITKLGVEVIRLVKTP